jgi:hypothetical protein
MTTLLHPLATYSKKSIDVFYGGNERETIDESAKLGYDCVKYLPKEEHVLYVNTLVDQESLEKTMHKFVSRRPRLLYMTWLEKSFMERLETLEYLIKEKKIGVLVINSFDCAAMTQRHRVELGQWIRRVRNTYQLRVVVFMQCRPGYYGVNGSLRFAAANLMEVGSYKKEHSAEFGSSRKERELAIASEFEVENTTDPISDAPIVSEGVGDEVITSFADTEEADETEPRVEAEVEEVIAEEDVIVEEEVIAEAEETVDEEETWISQSTDEELESMVKWFDGDFTSDAAKWVLEEIENRGYSLDRAQEVLLKNKELEVVDVA